MPTYDWACSKHTWEVVCKMAERDDPSSCPKCGEAGTKLLSAPNIDKTSAGSWNQASYNPGLGCWTHSTKHAEQIAKARGLEPVGNEPPENILKKHEKQREETRAARWADDREMLYGS
jgi:putative FmdB family regulatory protein